MLIMLLRNTWQASLKGIVDMSAEKPNKSNKLRLPLWRIILLCVLVVALFMGLYVFAKYEYAGLRKDHYITLKYKDLCEYDPNVTTQVYWDKGSSLGVLVELGEIRYEPVLESVTGFEQGKVSFIKNHMVIASAEYMPVLFVPQAAVLQGYDSILVLPTAGSYFNIAYVNLLDDATLAVAENEPRGRVYTAFVRDPEAHPDASQLDITGARGFFVGMHNGHIEVLVNRMGELDIKLLSIEDTAGRMIAKFEADTIIPVVSPDKKTEYEYTLRLLVDEDSVNRTQLRLNYQYVISDKDYQTYISGWAPYNEELYKATALNNHDNMDEFDFVFVTGDVVTFVGDEILLDRNLFIPQGKHLRLTAGQSVELTNDAVIFCRDSIEILGTEEEPVQMYSQNGEGDGLVVIKGSTRSKVNWLVVDGLAEINIGAYHLTGCITFYESDVDIKNSLFLNNSSEDGLNIVRSDCLIQNCRFENGYQDAFDADFCTGTFEGCFLKNIGNDGLDVSTSEFMVRNCRFNNIGDKAMSMGEASTVIMQDIIIDGAQIGVGVKDSSNVQGDVVHISNAIIAYCMYQKKPEFGKSTVNIDNVGYGFDVDFDYIIESKENLILNKQTMEYRGRKKEALIIEHIINEVPIT